jgi:hypothetical protein
LYALKDFLKFTKNKSVFLVWITDSLDGAYCVNRSKSTGVKTANLLRQIFYYCDIKLIQILAIWVPRDQNQIADYLSHLSFICNRDATNGDNVTDCGSCY